MTVSFLNGSDKGNMWNAFLNHNQDVVETLIWELEREMFALHKYP